MSKEKEIIEMVKIWLKANVDGECSDPIGEDSANLLEKIDELEDDGTPLDNNKLIAEFMGVKNIPDINSTPMFFEENECLGRELMYHTSWSWLMPVVEKIGSLQHRFMFKTDEGQHYCEIWCYKDGVISHEIGEIEDDTMLSSVYKSVVEFIKWYNENK